MQVYKLAFVIKDALARRWITEDVCASEPRLMRGRAIRVPTTLQAFRSPICQALVCRVVWHGRVCAAVRVWMYVHACVRAAARGLCVCALPPLADAAALPHFC